MTPRLFPETREEMSISPNEESTAEDASEILVAALRAACDKKARDMVVLDLRKVASFTDYFLISTGASTRQARTISDSVEQALRAAGRRPMHSEGYSNGEWILLDYGDLIVHTFVEATRKFYDLERLWRDAERVPLDLDEDGRGK